MADRTTAIAIFDDRTQAQRAIGQLKRAGFTEKRSALRLATPARRTAASSTAAKYARQRGRDRGRCGGCRRRRALGPRYPSRRVAGDRYRHCRRHSGSDSVERGGRRRCRRARGHADRPRDPRGGSEVLRPRIPGRPRLGDGGCGSPLPEAQAILIENGGYEMVSTSERPRSAAALAGMQSGAGTRAEEARTLEVREEELQIHKRPVTTGEAEVREGGPYRATFRRRARAEGRARDRASCRQPTAGQRAGRR